MLYDCYGAPIDYRRRSEPSPVAEAHVRSQVQSIDGLLDIKWYPVVGRYALVARWPTSDPRWQMYQSGEFDDCHDILGWFTVDMFDADTDAVPVDSIEQKVMELLGRSDNMRTDWKQRLKQIAEKNIKARKDKKQAVIDRAEAVATDLYNMSGRNEEVVMKRIMKQAAKELTE